MGRLIAGPPEAGSVTFALLTSAPLCVLRAPFILIRPSGPRTTPGTRGRSVSNFWSALGALSIVFCSTRLRRCADIGVRGAGGHGDISRCLGKLQLQRNLDGLAWIHGDRLLSFKSGSRRLNRVSAGNNRWKRVLAVNIRFCLKVYGTVQKNLRSGNRGNPPWNRLPALGPLIPPVSPVFCATTPPECKSHNALNRIARRVPRQFCVPGHLPFACLSSVMFFSPG